MYQDPAYRVMVDDMKPHRSELIPDMDVVTSTPTSEPKEPSDGSYQRSVVDSLRQTWDWISCLRRKSSQCSLLA